MNIRSTLKFIRSATSLKFVLLFFCSFFFCPYSLVCINNLAHCSFIHFYSFFLFIFHILLLIYFYISFFSILNEKLYCYCCLLEAGWFLEHKKHISFSSNIPVFLWYFSFFFYCVSQKHWIHNYTLMSYFYGKICSWCFPYWSSWFLERNIYLILHKFSL